MNSPSESQLPGALSIEQQFKLQALKMHIEGLSIEQAQDYVVEIMRQMMIKENLVKHLLSQH